MSPPPAHLIYNMRQSSRDSIRQPSFPRSSPFLPISRGLTALLTAGALLSQAGCATLLETLVPSMPHAAAPPAAVAVAPSTEPTPTPPPIVLPPGNRREIPLKPSAPPALYEKAAPEEFRCERFYTYKGKTLGCDSNVRNDADRLRPIISVTPAAIDELNTYQKNKIRLQNAAYFATAGLLLVIGGLSWPLPAGTVTNPNPGPPLPKTLLTGGGVGLFGGSIFFALGGLRANEAHLENAVVLYNRDHPATPIKLDFSETLTTNEKARREIRTAVYTGSAGLLLFVTGLFAGQGGGKALLQDGGGGIVLASAAYGLGSAFYGLRSDSGTSQRPPSVAFACDGSRFQLGIRLDFL